MITALMCMHVQDDKEKILETQLRAWLGIHDRLTIKNMGIKEDDVRKCAGSLPMDFWMHHVKPEVHLRKVALGLAHTN